MKNLLRVRKETLNMMKMKNNSSSKSKNGKRDRRDSPKMITLISAAKIAMRNFGST